MIPYQNGVKAALPQKSRNCPRSLTFQFIYQAKPVVAKKLKNAPAIQCYMKVLGICGSPRNANTEIALKEALAEVKKQGIKTETVLLREKNVSFCTHCNSCKDRPCPINDDMPIILKKMAEADGIIVASPTYFADVSAQLKALMDRTLPLRRQGMKLKNKVGGAIAIGASRNGGQEFVCSTIQRWMLLHEMIIVSDAGTAHFGGIGLGSSSNLRRIKKEDSEGLETIKNLGKKIAEIARMINK